MFCCLFTSCLVFAQQSDIIDLDAIADAGRSEQSVSELKRKIRQGNKDSFAILGLYYELGFDVKQDYQKAIDYYIIAMEIEGRRDAKFYFWYKTNARNAQVAYRLGSLLIAGYDKHLSFEKAQNHGGWLIKESADNGYRLAQARTAFIHRCLGIQTVLYMYNDHHKSKIGRWGDYEEVVKYYAMAADGGPASVQLAFADYLLESSGNDYGAVETAAYWYRAAAEQGNRRGQLECGKCYFSGTGVEKDVVEAMKWFLAAAGQNSKDAMNHLGFIYMNELEKTDENIEQALYWFEKAANAGSKYAMYNLGKYYKGTEDYTKAVVYLRRSADAGHSYACYELAMCYENGLGCSVDMVTAAKYYKVAADSEEHVVEAMDKMADLYNAGLGVRMDKREAEKYRERAEFYRR